MGRNMLDGGYIFVFQDLRGRFRSEGDYAMYRVPRGTYNKTTTDETTDAWDTIDWLVKHVPANTGKVGVWGTSYPGWLTLAAMRDPHPALAAAVPFNPVVDVWKADDWFHWGAFRFAYSFDFIYAMESRKGQNVVYPYGSRDLYAWLLPQGSAEQALGGRVDARHEMWRRLVENPSYTQYWRDCAADRWFDSPSRLRAGSHGARAVGPGGHLWRAGSLRRARAPRPRQRPQLLRCGPVVPRPALRRRQPPGRAHLRRRHGAALPRRRAHAVPAATS